MEKSIATISLGAIIIFRSAALSCESDDEHRSD